MLRMRIWSSLWDDCLLVLSWQPTTVGYRLISRCTKRTGNIIFHIRFCHCKDLVQIFHWILGRVFCRGKLLLREKIEFERYHHLVNRFDSAHVPWNMTNKVLFCAQCDTKDVHDSEDVAKVCTDVARLMRIWIMGKCKKNVSGTINKRKQMVSVVVETPNLLSDQTHILQRDQCSRTSQS